jgi:hypothetical protein
MVPKSQTVTTPLRLPSANRRTSGLKGGWMKKNMAYSPLPP